MARSILAHLVSRNVRAGVPVALGLERNRYGTSAWGGDGVLTPYVPDTPSQDTLTLGATSWF